MLVLILAALALPAHAGDLEIQAQPPVRVFVDGQRAPHALFDRAIWVQGLLDGEHKVEVVSVLGPVLATLTVTLTGEERAVLRYEDRMLIEVGRGQSLAVERAAQALTGAAARAAEAEAVAAQAEAQAAEARARAAEAHASAARAGAAAAEVQALLLTAGFGPLTIGLTTGARVPEAPAPGGLSAGTGGLAQASASFSGLDPELFSVTLGGQAVSYEPHLGAFVATDLSPGTVPLVISLEGALALSSPFTTEGGQHTACAVLVHPDGYDTGCASGGLPLTSADVARGRPATGFAEAEPPATIHESLLRALLESVRATPRARDQVGLLAAAAQNQMFSCTQVARLLEPIAYNRDKLEALRALRPAIVDPQRAFLIEAAFPYTADKEQVRALFAGQSASPQGAPQGTPTPLPPPPDIEEIPLP